MPVEVVAKAKYCSNSAITSGSIVTIKDSSTIYVHKSDKIDNDDLIENHMIEMFKFHSILPMEANPNQIYGQILLDKIDKAKKGQNTVFLCYGQYKSGKTHTILGKNDQKIDPKTTMGLLPRALQQILNISTQLTHNDRCYSVSLRILRIFNDKLHDVLSNDSDIRIIDRKGGKGRITWTKNAITIPIKSIEDFNSVITKINNDGTIPPHNHIIYTLYLECSDKNIKYKQSVHSQIHFVELASSDKLTHFIQKKSHPLYPLSPNGKAMNINHQTNKFLHQTLESLVTIFTFLKQNAKFIPLRNSKLTHILKDCLNDNTSNIVIFLTIIPLQKYLNETLKTLHFGEQIYYQCTPTKITKPKQISKSTKINIDSSNHLLSDYDAKQYPEASSNIIQLLYEMKELISSPSKIKPTDIENMHHRISDMIIYLRHSNHDMMHSKNMVRRLENENKMLREHINKQNKVIINFKKAIEVEKESHIQSKPAQKQSTSPKVYVDSKIDDIEQRLKEHTSTLQSLQDECIQNIQDTAEIYTKDDESSTLPLSEIIEDIRKTKSNELEKVFAARHKFETLNI